MNILVIPDLHAPFHHPEALAFLRSMKNIWDPDVVVCLGDLGDQHGWSRHERMPDAPGQGDEDELCLDFCSGLYRLFPVVRACIGNHDDRLAKRCVRAGVPSRLHRTVAEIYNSPVGWEWKNSHLIDGLAFTHGEGFSGREAAIKCAIVNRVSTSIGHVHSAAGVTYTAGPYSTIWGMSCGCLIDENAPGFAYAKKSAARPVLGCGVIMSGVPHFEPLR